SGSSLGSGISPADRIRQPRESPQLRTGHKTTHVVTAELRTGSLGGEGGGARRPEPADYGRGQGHGKRRHTVVEIADAVNGTLADCSTSTARFLNGPAR